MIKHWNIGISIPTGLMLLIFSAFVVAGCGHGPIKPTPKPTPRPPIASLGYIIQAGAFANMENAVRFTEKLRARGVDAYHFYDRSKLYKVRFGNFASRTDARKRANYLVTKGLIDDFYIVAPATHETVAIRDNIIKTADSFIGVPYRWGGKSVEEGFDCSGFTMTVYKLNGLDLPRSSRAQWQKGTYVNRSRMKKGDLVFFRTTSSTKISHVGIYEGNGRFIHAPGRGDHVQRASLNSRYFSRHYTGAKTYF